MIEQLSFTVRFPPTDHYVLGRYFDRTFDFSKGMTAITGPNENGKTLTLEMIEFLLFGAKALRGKADDYKHLKASGRVAIRGVPYTIERTIKNAALRAGGDTLAVGTKPVNARIIALLGYGLDVFRVANVANQGDAERLSKMLPTERKAMVDKLIGADEIERVAAWCGEEALGVARENAGLERGLGAEPVQPVRPEGYRPADELRGDIESLRSLRDTITKGEAFLANEPVVPEVGEPPTLIPLATLEKADQILGLRTYAFDLKQAEEQDAAHQLWKERQAFVSRAFPQPTLTAEQLAVEQRAQGIIADLRRLEKSPEILCPCGKPFTTADAELLRLKAELGGLDRPFHLAPFDLDIEAAATRTWAKEEVQVMWDRLKDAVETGEPDCHPREAKGAVHVSEVTKALAELGVSTMTRRGVQELAGELRAYQAVCAARDGAQARRDAWEASAKTTRAAVSLARRAYSDERLAHDEALLALVTVYDAQVAAYEAQLAAWTEGRERLRQLRLEEDSWRAGKAALNEVRQETKTYVAPALSRVASHMLAQMTGGQRGRFVVDEDFEAQVDGQPLATLSGSGKVCANLAFRLGLGRILTNGVFPVFMGDEMDASMDADRAGHLHDALTALDDRLHQILVITHKTPACPQVIKLEN